MNRKQSLSVVIGGMLLALGAVSLSGFGVKARQRGWTPAWLAGTTPISTDRVLPATIVAACPASFTVNSLGDTSDAAPGDMACADAGGQCTLRTAIQESNALTACPAIAINFSVTGTINLGGALPSVNHDLNINGPATAPGITVRRDTGGNYTVFVINSGRAVSIANLTITNGYASDGGGIINRGQLTLTGCTLTGNTAIGAGGGLWDISGSTALTNCTISGNTARIEAGISTVNTVPSTLSLTNCTITNNTTSEDIGGVFVAPSRTLVISNTIIAGNTGQVRPDIVIGSGASSSSQGYNLIGNNTATGFIPTTGDQTGTSAAPLNPRLTPLGSYGGPTLTHALQCGSPAIDAGAGALSADQRGLPRSQDGDGNNTNAPDIGAFEVQKYTVTNTADSGVGSLRRAVFDNEAAGGGLIAFNIPGGGVQSINLASGLGTIDKPFTIDGYTQPGASRNTLAQGNNAVLLIELNGSGASGNSAIFVIAGYSCLRGLAINNFAIAGIVLSGAIATNNWINGNFIGVRASGANAAPNLVGIFIQAGAHDNLIGSDGDGVSDPAERNVISGNTDKGVSLLSGAGTGNRILGNAIFGNGALGIDLSGDGVTANDADDADTGVNNLQNFPVLGSVTTTGAVSGSLDSLPANTAYPARIEFFANTSCDASGNGEGEVFLGFTNVSAPGNFTANVTLVAGKPFITATATDANGNTSEFSACRHVNTPPTITAGGTLTRQQGSAATNSPVATVSDADQSANTLSVTATPLTGTGVTVSNISIAAGGGVTADVATSCGATNSTFTLKVTDNAGEMATATLTVNVTANAAPTLAYPATANIAAGGSTTVGATTASDNGSITGYQIISVSPAMATAPTVNGSGVVSITNAGPLGNHTITVLATDNCGAAAIASFAVNVACPAITISPLTMPGIGVGAAYTQTFTQLGAPSVTWSLSGTLPAGVSFNATTGALSGTPTQAGTFAFTVTATASFGCAGSRTYALVVAPAGCNSVRFGVNVGPAAGTSPTHVLVGDFNLDGKPDLASTDAAGVSVSLGNGMGGFGAPVHSSAGTYSLAMAAGDFNLDGKPDLVLARDGFTIAVMLGDGLGGFAAPVDIPSLNHPQALAVGDFNLDGNPDLLVGGSISYVLFGDGIGGFPTRITLPVESSTFAVAVGDFNRDGKPDLATANITANTAQILLGDGLGGFAAPVSYAVSQQPLGMAAGDFNLDGKLDLAVACYAPNVIAVLLGDGAGGFAPAINASNSPGLSPRDVTVADFNLDGKPDLATANVNSSSLSILFGNGAGGFATPFIINNTSNSHSVAVGDFNLDGKPDVAAPIDVADNILVRFNTCVANMPPVVTPMAVNVQQGSPATASANLGTVADDATAPNALAKMIVSSPAGVTVSNLAVAANGAITATVAAGCTAPPGANTVSIQFTDGGGLSTTANFTVNVATNPAPALAYPATASVTAGGSTTVSATTASDNGSISGFSIVSVAPAMNVAPTVNGSGAISLTNAGPSGGHVITVRATDNCGATTDASFTLNAGCQTITVTPPATNTGTVGVAFSQTFTQTGGIGTTAFSTASALPTGLGLSSGGALGGTPTQSGVFPIAVKATDANGCMGTASYTLTINCPAISIMPASLPNGTAGLPYAMTTLAASGGAGSYSFSLMSGTLPAGLTLSAAGVISGTPTAFGNFTPEIKATDANGCSGSRSYTLLINPPCAGITINPASLPNGFVGTPYSQTLSGSGGAAPYSFVLSSGALPAGLNLASGVITGTPATLGTFNFTLQTTDANGCTGTRAYTVIISGSGLMFYPLAHPVRLLDTRSGFTGCDSPGAPIPGGTSRAQTARRTCDGLSIPANAAAITGNITTAQSGGGYLTLYPSDAAQPLVANSNYGPNEILNNVFTVGLGNADGAFRIFVTSTTEVVVDVTGYYAPPNTGGLYFHPLPKPIRLLETRTGFTGCNAPSAPLLGGVDTTQQARLTCDGVTIPATAQAIVGNATTVNPAGPGFPYLTLFPADAARPLVANSNYLPGQIMNAPFTVGLSAAGEFKIYPTTQTDLVIDVLGYYSADVMDANGAGLLFTPLGKPVRLLETRMGFTGCFATGTPLPAGSTRTQPARGMCNGETVAANALGIVGNATVVNTGGGYLTFWPSSATQPLVAASNFDAGQVFNRHFIVGLGAGDGAFKVYTQFQTDLVIDASGFFAP